jgi:hypothetical protein
MSLYSFVFPQLPIRFESRFSITESVDRLRARTKRWPLNLTRQIVAGRVTENDVRLQRSIPFFGNSYKPIFAGSFVEDGGRVFLVGKFRIFLFSQAFMTVWLSFALIWSVLAVFSVSMHWHDAQPSAIPKPMSALFPLFGLGMFFLGLLFIRFFWRISRSDIMFISNVLRDALGEEAT